VFSEAGAGEAHGDIFTDLFVSDCNARFQDESFQGLNAPGLPLDDIDALTEPPVEPGPCDIPALGFVPCPAFSVDSDSAIEGALDPLGIPIRPADVLVPPGSPQTGIMTGDCPAGGRPCVAVQAPHLRLDSGGAGTDDVDALCWFDLDTDGLPGLPLAVGGPDQYYFSLARGSDTLAAEDLRPGDILAPDLEGIALAVFAGRLGLADGDNLDGLTCLDPDSDKDFVRDVMDNCPFTFTPWWVPGGDGDCDGFTSPRETFLTTDPNDNCPDDTSDDAWPPDINKSGLVNGLDVGALRVPFGSSAHRPNGPPDANYWARVDFNDDGLIGGLDVGSMRVFFGKGCT